jgi:magnesium-transporting ATPase (P-type)
MFFNDNILKIFNVLEEGVIITPWSLKVLVLLVMSLVLISIYCFYLFRKTLRYFQQRKPFDSYVIITYNKIGNLLLFSGIVGSILNFIFLLVFKGKFMINIGLSPYLFVICLGLFFMVLSETFKIAKTAKEENELTI